MRKTRFAVCALETPAMGGGLYTVTLTGEGKLEKTAYLPLDRPMYAVAREAVLYALRREAFERESGLCRFAVGKDGSLQSIADPVSTRGIVACHLSAVDEELYAVNYLSGNVIKLPDTVVSFSGHGVHPTRQDASHPHQIIPSPDGRFLLSTDLGLDKIRVFDRDLRPCAAADVPAGYGARHLAFSPDGRVLYCVNELVSSVSVFSWNGKAGDLRRLDTVECPIAPSMAGHNLAAAIRVTKNGERLCISNRGEDTLAVFAIENGTRLSLLQKISCGGSGPRDFILTKDERFLLCANEKSSSVTVFRWEQGKIGELADTLSLPHPICLAPLSYCES